MIRSEDCERAIRKGLDFLAKNQLPSGEFKTLVSRDMELAVEPRHDSSPFATAHIVSSLASFNFEECNPIIQCAAKFLLSQRLIGGLWKFWVKNHPGFWDIPADMDDTCVVSLALRDAKITFSQNLGVLTGNMDESGRFFTWIQRRPLHTRKIFSLWILLPIAKSVLGRKGFFQTGEARREDIDAVVNANVVRHFAAHSRATSGAVEWLWQVIQSGGEKSADRYYQNEFALYHSIARGLQDNVTPFFRFKTMMQNRMVDRLNENGSIGQTVQDTALAAVALVAVGANREVIQKTACYLLSQQRADGSWSAHSYYYGGWSRDFCWGSRELTTGFCIEALSHILIGNKHV